MSARPGGGAGTGPAEASAADRALAPVPIIALGIGGGCIASIQPVLLDLMLRAGRLSIDQVGFAATAEGAGMAIAATLAAFFLPVRRLRMIALAAVALAAAVNGLTTASTGAGIIALRLLNGLCSGLLLWLLVGMMARHSRSARMFAAYVTCQSLAALTLSLVMSGWVAPRFGPGGGYACLAVLDLVLILAALRVPRAFPQTAEARRGLPPPRAAVALLGVAGFIAGISAMWVYLIPQLRSLGYAQGEAATAVTTGLASQLVGGLAALVLAHRLTPHYVWAVGTAAAAGAIGVMITAPPMPLVLAAAVLFGTCWMIVPPFQMPVLVALDPSMRGPMLVGSAQLAGSSLGPVLVPLFLTADQSTPGAALAAFACLGVSLACLVSQWGRLTR